MTNNKGFFSNLKWYDFLIVCTIVIVICIFSHLYVNTLARNKLWVKTYPLRANLALLHMQCSKGSPTWMKEMLKYQTQYAYAPSNQIAYIATDGELFHCESGYLGKYPLLSEKNTKNARYRYASVTKLWTSDTILDLIKQEKLSLDTKLVDIITEIDKPIDTRMYDITIEDLLLHRSGFDRNNAIKGVNMLTSAKPICPNNFQALNRVELAFSPNEEMRYSNLGYCLLGEIISRIENKPYIEVIKEKYELSKTNIRFIDNFALDDEVYYNYVETSLTGYSDIYTAFDYKGLASAAGLSGNAIDLALQVKKMALKPVPNIFANNKSIKCDKSILTDCYGYAMFSYQPTDKVMNSEMVYFRDGTLLGVSSVVAITEKGDLAVILSNGSPNNFGEDSSHIKEALYTYMISNN